MARPSKIPFEITPVISRYLRDIQFGKEDLDDPSITSKSGDWFLVSTWKSKEEYSSEVERNLEGMKTYLGNQKIAYFPTLQDYEKKFGIKFSDEASLEYLHDPNTNERFVFEKSFPVEVLDLEALKKFRKTYCLNEQGPKTSTRYESREKLRFENHTLSYLGEKSYTITDKMAQSIFDRLWNHREHFIKGSKAPNKAGEPESLRDFIVKVGITAVKLASDDVQKSAQKRIRGLVGNVRRDFKSVSIELECKAKKVLLIIKEK